MLRVVLLSVILAAVSAQHHVDPFAGSGCDCATFCSGKCAINATVSRLSCTRASCPYTTARVARRGRDTRHRRGVPRAPSSCRLGCPEEARCSQMAQGCAGRRRRRALSQPFNWSEPGPFMPGHARGPTTRSLTHPSTTPPPSIAFSLSFSSSPTHSFQPAANMTLYR